MDLKVKKFRIRPRLATVSRILKGLMSVKQLPQDVELMLPDEAQTFTAKIGPAAFYPTWSRDEVPAAFKETLSGAGLQKAVSVSCLVATAGAVPEEMLSELLMNGETVKAQMITALAEEAADQSLNFLFRLLADDAKTDDCELSEPILVATDSLLADALELLEGEREGVTIDQAAHLTPRFTRVAIVAWLPIAKRRKQAPPPKKKSV